MLGHLIVVLYILIPITLLTGQSLLSGVFYTLVAASFALLVQQRFAGVMERTKKYGPLIVSYSIFFFAVASSSIYHGEWAGANSEGALRFFLGLWVLLLALPQIANFHLRHAIWGVYAAALISTTILLWLIVEGDPRPKTPGVILTTYSSVMLLLSAISAYSIKWQLTSKFRLESALKVLAASISFIGFLIAQTRTGLLGLPLFILLAILLFIGLKRPRRVVTWLLISLSVIAATVASDDALRGRIVQGIQEVHMCQGKNSTQHSSMCIRLQLWRTAIDAGSTHPWTGLGEGGKFIQYVKEVAIPKGLAAQYIVDEYFGEPHNDLMLMFAGFGIPGFFGLLLIYLIPCVYFFPRLLKQTMPLPAKAAAAMGLAVCLGFFMFGLTETMFRRMNTIGFYTAMVALFIVLSESRPSQNDLSIG